MGALRLDSDIRHYDPALGRFLQQDPDPGKISDPSTFVNKYSYVSNKPTVFTDPTGMFSLGELAGFLVGIIFPIQSAILLNTTDFFQSAFGFTTADKNALNLGYVTAAVIGASILTGGAAAGAAGASGVLGALIGAGAGAVTGAVVGGVGFTSTGLGTFQQGASFGGILGAGAGAIGGFGIAHFGDYLAGQWNYATKDTMNYFFNLSYDKSPLFGSALGGGFAGPSLGGSAIYGGLTYFLGQPRTN